MNFNHDFIYFLTDNWALLILLTASFLPIIPPKWFNYEEDIYVWDKNGNIIPEKTQKRQRLTFTSAIIHLFSTSILDPFSNFFARLMALFSFKETVSIIIFAVIGFSVVVLKQISSSVVILTGIGLLALYLQQLIETGEEINFGPFHWTKSKDNPNPSSPHQKS